MKRFFVSRALALVLAALPVATLPLHLTGCSSVTVDENDPASMMRDAEDDIHSDRYQVAIDKLRVIRNKFPYSKYSIDAQLRMADVYFLMESYAEAATAYESFRDLHPKHEKVEYAMYRVGESHFLDTPENVARDLSSAHRALDAFDDYVKRFPTAADAPAARKRIAQIRGKLADKELYIGEFYYKRDQYDSAKGRFEKIVASYPDTTAAKTAQERLAYIAKHEEKAAKK